MKKIIVLLMLLIFSLPALSLTFISPALAAPDNNSTIVADFSASQTSGNAPLQVTFTDLSTGSPSLNSWSWSFGDGTTSRFPVKTSPVHTYNRAGTYTVSLTVTNNAGRTSTKSSNIVVTASTPPVASFTATPVSGNAPLTVTFTDTSTGAPTSWLWNFGDGTTYNSKRPPAHIYSVPRSYTVSLTVRNVGGNSTQSSSITVSSNSPFVTDFSASVTSGRAPLTVQFNDLTTGSPTTWAWDFGDGTNSTAKNPVHTYSKTGTYTVTLRAGSGTASSTNTKTNYITVGNGLQASFIVSPGQGNAPLAVQFSDTSTRTTNTWLWDFGDGTTSNLQSPSHTYVQAGNYTVRLTASNGIESNTSEISSAVIVLSATTPVVNAPVIDFSSNVTSGKAPLTVLFTDNSTGNVSSWFWDFGDGSTSTVQNPIHIYNRTGSYSVTLNASNRYTYGVQTRSGYITVTDEESSGGGSSSVGIGSSTGGASPEPPSNIDVKMTTQRFVSAGNRIKFEFSENTTNIDYIEFDAKKTLGKITTTVEQLKGKSVMSPTKPSRTVYKYVNIWVGNKDVVTPETIENATIEFKVEKSMALINDTEDSTVTLQRYNGGKWNPLKTIKTREDDKYIYYIAETPGFSPFAITLGKISDVGVNTSLSKSQNALPVIIGNQLENNRTGYVPGSPSGGTKWIKYGGAIWFLVVLMVVLFIGLAVKERRK